MAHQNRIVKELTPKDKVKILQRRLNRLRNDCADSEKRKTIVVADIVMMMKFMVEQLNGDNERLFETCFVGHLQIISELARGFTIEFIENFRQITELMCELCTKNGLHSSFLNHSLKLWLQCMEHIPSQQKYQIFREIDRNLVRKCGRFLVNAESISMQTKMLDIICSYLHGEHLRGADLLVKSYIFVSLLDGAIILSDEATKRIKEIVSTNSVITFTDKNHLLNLINRSISYKMRSIFSRPINSLKPHFLASKMRTDNPGWLHFNKPTSSAEIWLPANESPEKVIIKAQHLKGIHLKEYSSTLEIKFMLNTSPCYKTAENKVNKTFGPSVDVTISECCPKKLRVLLGEVFPGMDCQIVRCQSNEKSDVTPSVQNSETTFRPILKHAEFSSNMDKIELTKKPPTHSTFYGEIVSSEHKNPDTFQVQRKRSASSRVENDMRQSTHRSPLQHYSSIQSMDSTQPTNSIESSNSIEPKNAAIYDYNELDVEPTNNKKRRVTQIKQKRKKPDPWPRIKKIEVPRREKLYTIRVRRSVSLSKSSISANAKVPAIITENIDKINQKSVETPLNGIRDPVRPPAMPLRMNKGSSKSRKLYTNMADKSSIVMKKISTKNGAEHPLSSGLTSSIIEGPTTSDAQITQSRASVVVMNQNHKAIENSTVGHPNPPLAKNQTHINEGSDETETVEPDSPTPNEELEKQQKIDELKSSEVNATDINANSIRCVCAHHQYNQMVDLEIKKIRDSLDRVAVTWDVNKRVCCGEKN